MSERILINAARKLSRDCSALQFGGAVAWVYNPLDYAWPVHKQFIQRFGGGPKKALFLGMNPGPFGMMQTGVPFGEVAAVRDWMQLDAKVSEPAQWHPKRRIEGFNCQRAEVSGRRLWGWAAETFGTAESFFDSFFVVNYCPLVFLEASGRNLTPDKLPAHEQAAIGEICDAHLNTVLATLSPEWAIGVGAYAAKRLAKVTGCTIDKGDSAIRAEPNSAGMRVGQIIHPSPASPVANRGWAPAAHATLEQLGLV
ncbi:MAG: uracil-DNA glycosylase family protein [Burkholderiaceae bacterium]